MTEFVINRFNGAETRDWMASRPALRKDLVDVVENIVGVWPLVVSYLKETRREDDGDNLVIRSSAVGVLTTSCKCAHHFFAVLEKGDGRVSVPQSACPHEMQAVPSSVRNLQVS